MQLRFDKEGAYTAVCSLSSDSTALFYIGDKKAFIHKICEHETLVARTIPYNSGPVTAKFDIRGLRNIAEKYNEDTGWF